jgi:molybdopterin/thiamine biosynthesis adenylyltransferase
MFVNSKITICGAGTLGSNLVENLARIGFNSLKVIDFDTVEKKNIGNQIYGNCEVGYIKVKALAELMYRNVGIRIEGVNKKLSIENGHPLILGSDLVVDAFDNHRARKDIANICNKSDIPCIHMGLSNDGYGEVIWNERYKVPADAGKDPCEDKNDRSLSLIVVAVATESIISFIKSKNGISKRSYTITLSDFSIQSI